MIQFVKTERIGRWRAIVLAAMLWLPSAALAQEPACAGTELAAARASLSDSIRAMDRAIKTLDNPSGSDGARLQAWLGVNSSSAAAEVKAKFVRMRNFADAVTFRCAVRTEIRLGDVFAYVDPNNAFNVVLGAFFFSSPPSGYCSKLGILVHEISHFTLAGAARDPSIYGPTEALNLARTNPGEAQRNAENFEYFVESLVFGLPEANARCS